MQEQRHKGTFRMWKLAHSCSVLLCWGPKLGKQQESQVPCDPSVTCVMLSSLSPTLAQDVNFASVLISFFSLASHSRHIAHFYCLYSPSQFWHLAVNQDLNDRTICSWDRSLMGYIPTLMLQTPVLTISIIAFSIPQTQRFNCVWSSGRMHHFSPLLSYFLLNGFP